MFIVIRFTIDLEFDRESEYRLPNCDIIAAKEKKEDAELEMWQNISTFLGYPPDPDFPDDITMAIPSTLMDIYEEKGYTYELNGDEEGLLLTWYTIKEV